MLLLQKDQLPVCSLAIREKVEATSMGPEIDDLIINILYHA
jgi:hypothetical protein